MLQKVEFRVRNGAHSPHISTAAHLKGTKACLKTTAEIPMEKAKDHGATQWTRKYALNLAIFHFVKVAYPIG